MVLLSCRYPFYWCRVRLKKNKKNKKKIENTKLKQKINNDRFLLRFYNKILQFYNAFDAISVQLIFSMLGA